jgi:hypothetical protein
MEQHVHDDFIRLLQVLMATNWIDILHEALWFWLSLFLVHDDML